MPWVAVVKTWVDCHIGGWSSIHQCGFMQLYTNNKDSFYRMDDHKPNTIHVQSFDHGTCIPVQLQARSAG